MLRTDGHFLSAHNPLATAQQRALEARALALLGTDPLRRAREQTAMRWKTLAGRTAPDEAWGRFDGLLDEFVYNYALKAVAGDPDHPVVLGQMFGPPHEWFGMHVPGSRASGGDGPDQHYVLIPVVAGAQYEIEGRRFDPAPADVPLTVTGNSSCTMTLGGFDMGSIEVGDDGRFRLTAGPEPANGDPNHVHVPPRAMYLFIRECRGDWREIPSAMSVRRLDPVDREPWTDEQTCALAAAMMVEDVAPLHWFVSLAQALEPNSVPAPFNAGGVGGLTSQSVLFARLHVDPDHAFIFNVRAGGAPYHGFTLYDYWFRSIEYWERPSSRTRGQSQPNPDGSFTYVVAHEDPGLANWLDPGGFEHLTVLHRWQGMPAEPGPEGSPAVDGRLVALDDLDSAVADDCPRATPEQRTEELADRLATFLLRYQTD